MTELLLSVSVLLLAVIVALAARLRRQERDARVAGEQRDRISAAEAAALEGEKALQAEILDSVDQGVILFDDVLGPKLANRAARRMLGVRGESLPARLASGGVLSLARRAIVEGAVTQEVVSIWPGRRRLHVRAAPRPDEGGAIVVMQDVTDELRTQQVRRQFVANASHELKSPVASLEALSEAILHAVQDDPPAATRFATRLISEAERLGRLVTDLLDLSRLEDPTNISTTPIDLSNVVKNLLDETQAAARNKQMTITAQISADTWIRGDNHQLSLMIRNLLDNAVRYTPERGSVSVDVFREGHDVVVSVTDTGIGIPLASQARVFERFYRINDDRSRETGGTGLGLSIVKHVAELHGGHVGLQSELGEGSVFTVRLPALSSANGNSQATPSNRVAGRPMNPSGKE
jgi:signal transduction histidine kinase